MGARIGDTHITPGGTFTTKPTNNDVTRFIVQRGLSSGYTLRRITAAVTNPKIRKAAEDQIIRTKTGGRVTTEKKADEYTPGVEYLLMKSGIRPSKAIELAQRAQLYQTIKRYRERGYTVIKTDKGYIVKHPKQIAYEKKRSEIEEFYKTAHPLAAMGHIRATGIGSWEDPLGLKSFYYTLTGQREKIIDIKTAAALSLDEALTKGTGEYIKTFVTGPMATIGLTYGITSGIGAGIGAVKAISPTAGKILTAGVIGYGAKETGTAIYKAYKKGPAELFGTAGYMAALTPIAGAGFKAGYAYGYGHISAMKYALGTYGKGTIEYIRFKEALRTTRLLKVVKTHKMDPLNIAKDIMRMDKKTAGEIINYLKAHPRTTVIGGSAASYTQVVGARAPRDIDLLITKGKLLKGAFKELGRKPHIIDIHGPELGGKAGVYHKFGFITQKPIKIGKYLYMRATEQLFRKGTAAVMAETRYRHGLYPGFPSRGTMQAPKDVFDFITIGKSLIKSAGKSINPFTKLRGKYGAIHLQRFIYPKTSPYYGKKPSLIESFIKKYSKPVKIPEISAKSLYIYPKSMVGSYFIPSLLKPGYRPPITFKGKYITAPYKKPGFIPPGVIPLPSKTVIPPFTIPDKDYKIPIPIRYEIPPVKIPVVPVAKTGYSLPTAKYKPILGKEEFLTEYITKKMKYKISTPKIDMGYREREFKVLKIEELLNVNNFNLGVKIV